MRYALRVTAEIALVLGILAVAVVLFVTEWLRMDVVALLVLAAVALTGLVTPAEALSGFSNPAVITVWAMFMISAALARTGVAGVIGRHVLRLAGRGEVRMISVIMLTSGTLSAFMNNIGVAALLLPVVMDIARRQRRPPSRLLMPLAFGCLLGGLTTLIGTPPNLLVSEALDQRGLASFQLFDFAMVGVPVMLAGTAFMALVGRHLLPVRRWSRGTSTPNLPAQYGLHEHAIVMTIGPGSPLIGKTLAASRLRAATGLNVFAIAREGSTQPAPEAGFVLRAGDRLMMAGRLDRFGELQGWRELEIERESLGLESLASEEIDVLEMRLGSKSSFVGRTLGEIDFRNKSGATVLAIRRGDTIFHSNLVRVRLQQNDRCLVQGKRADLETLQASDDFDRVDPRPLQELTGVYNLESRLFAVRVPDESVLVGRSLSETRLGDAFRLGVLGIKRGETTHLLPTREEPLAAGDRLLVRGERDDLQALHGLQQLRLETEAPHALEMLQSEQVGLVEAMLSPRTTLAGRTVRDLNFHERYGLQVLAVFRQGQAHQADLRDMELRLGDGLLLLGRRDKLLALAREPDFLVLTEAAQAPVQPTKAPLSAAIMAGVLAPVLLGWIPLPIAAVVGATLMVATRCLSMEEAYRSVEWKSIFLIAGMLPLGAALQGTGAAAYIAERVVEVCGPLGPWGIVVGLYLVTALATSIIPTSALVVLMAPIVLKACADAGISHQSAMMAIAMAASASFTSPISHPANVLVMGPGGYRFADYVRLGIPLTLVVLAMVLIFLPIFWPL